MNIRLATHQDHDAIQAIYLSAFAENERTLVAKLALDLLVEKTTPQTFSFIAEINHKFVGHIAFSPISLDKHQDLQGYILAPLAVEPSYQKQRIGTKLIEYGIQQLSAMGVHIVFVYGDPHYYGRFGFSTDTVDYYTPPYPLQYPFGWQARKLINDHKIQSPTSLTCVTPLCNPKLW
jgi:putative acetyltransferase